MSIQFVVGFVVDLVEHVYCKQRVAHLVDKPERLHYVALYALALCLGQLVYGYKAIGGRAVHVGFGCGRDAVGGGSVRQIGLGRSQVVAATYAWATTLGLWLELY